MVDCEPDSDEDHHQFSHRRMESEPYKPPPAILVVTCSSPNVGQIADERAGEETEVRDVDREISECLEQEIQPAALNRRQSLSPFPTVEVGDELEMQLAASSMAKPHQGDSPAAAEVKPELELQPPTQSKRFSLMKQRLRFCIRETPAMSRGEQVRFLRTFRFGDTYKLKTRNWLIPQFLSGALTLMGVVLTLVGIISLQINKYLHACDLDDGIDCQSNTAKINNVMMPIGVGTTGGGLSLILISGFVFVHAFCVIYEDADNEEDGIHDGVLHIPTSTRAALLGSNTGLTAEDIARCQSYYDNLQGYAAN